MRWQITHNCYGERAKSSLWMSWMKLHKDFFLCFPRTWTSFANLLYWWMSTKKTHTSSASIFSTWTSANMLFGMMFELSILPKSARCKSHWSTEIKNKSKRKKKFIKNRKTQFFVGKTLLEAVKFFFSDENRQRMKISSQNRWLPNFCYEFFCDFFLFRLTFYLRFSVVETFLFA